MNFFDFFKKSALRRERGKTPASPTRRRHGGRTPPPAPTPLVSSPYLGGAFSAPAVGKASAGLSPRWCSLSGVGEVEFFCRRRRVAAARNPGQAAVDPAPPLPDLDGAPTVVSWGGAKRRWRGWRWPLQRLAACEAAGSSRKSTREAAVTRGGACAGVWAVVCRRLRGGVAPVRTGGRPSVVGESGLRPPSRRRHLRRPPLQPPIPSPLLSSSFFSSSLFLRPSPAAAQAPPPLTAHPFLPYPHQHIFIDAQMLAPRCSLRWR